MSAQTLQECARPNSWHQRVKAPWMRDLFRPIEQQELVVGKTNKIITMNERGRSADDIFETCTDRQLQPTAVPISKLPANIVSVLK